MLGVPFHNVIFPLVKAESHKIHGFLDLTCKRNLSLKLTAWKWASPLIRFTLKPTTCQIDLRIKSRICTIAWIAYWFRFFKIVSSAKSEGQQNQSFQLTWSIPRCIQSPVKETAISTNTGCIWPLTVCITSYPTGKEINAAPFLRGIDWNIHRNLFLRRSILMHTFFYFNCLCMNYYSVSG